MHKYELEQLLMDSEGMKRLTERAAGIKERYGGRGGTEGEAAERLGALEPPPHAERPTAEEIQANDQDHLAKSDLTINLTRFVGEGEEDDVRTALKALSERCKRDPSESNQVFLEDGINQLISAGAPDDVGLELVNAAVQVLESIGRPQRKREQRR